MKLGALREKLFQYRSYTPIPFLILMIVFAQPTEVLFVAGCLVMAFGELIRFWGVAYAGPLTRATGSVGAPEVIVRGPFAYVRNPLYVGNMVAYVGVGLMANALMPWLLLGAAAYFAFQYAMIVSLEEEFLEKEFGDTYVAYKRAVPAFLPRLRRFSAGAQERQKPDWKAALRSERRTLQALALVSALIVARWLWG